VDCDGDIMNTLMTDCPRHEGAFDCTPFCEVCEGEQRYEWTPFRRCVKCPTEVAHDVWFEELGMCFDCSHAYWSHEEEKEIENQCRLGCQCGNESIEREM